MGEPNDRWLIASDPHMDGWHTVVLAKYADSRPGTVSTKVPPGYEIVPVDRVADLLAERDRLAAEGERLRAALRGVVTLELDAEGADPWSEFPSGEADTWQEAEAAAKAWAKRDAEHRRQQEQFGKDYDYDPAEDQ